MELEKIHLLFETIALMLISWNKGNAEEVSNNYAEDAVLFDNQDGLRVEGKDGKLFLYILVLPRGRIVRGGRYGEFFLPLMVIPKPKNCTHWHSKEIQFS